MDTKTALDRMMDSCSRRECCRKEIRAKLERLAAKGGAVVLTSAQMDEIIGTLCRERFIDEARYASAFARDRSSLQGWGPLRIRRALASKGISGEDIDSALESVDEASADARMESLLRAKVRSIRGCDDPQARLAKVLRYGLSRGYEYGHIVDCYRKISESE